jgi:hypothetical protein
MKYLVKEGKAMFVARMLLNSTSVTGYDAGGMLAISRCVQITTFSFAYHPKTGYKCTGTIPIMYKYNEINYYAFLQVATRNIIKIDIEGCPGGDNSKDKLIRTLDGSVLHWTGVALWKYNSTSFKYNRLNSAENIPNFTHLHLMANIIDNPMDADFDTLSDMIQNSSLNILKILSISNNNGNILFDPHTLAEAAIQSVTVMKEVAENVLSTIFPLHKIITIIVLIMSFVVIILILVIVIRCCSRRKKRKVSKRAITHLKSLMNIEDGYVDPIELNHVDKKRRQK